MKSLRDIKNKARLHLHDRMKVEVLHVTPGSQFGTPVTCRVHNTVDALGMTSDMSAYKGEMPTRQLDSPRLVFLRSELSNVGVELKKDHLIVVSADEAYKLDNADPIDGITVIWNASRLTKNQIEGLPKPGC